MNKRIVLAAASLALTAAALLSTPAVRAADLVTKAPKLSAALFGTPCTPTTCTGFYAGAGLGGVGTNLDIIGQGLDGSVLAGGMLPTFRFGYLYAQNNWLFGVDASSAYQTNSSATVANATGNQNGMLLTQGLKFGGNFSQLLGINPQAPVTIPASLAAAVISLYGQAGAAEHQITGGWVSGEYSGAGVLFDTGLHSFVDIDYKNIQYGATTSGVAKFNSENVITASWNYKF